MAFDKLGEIANEFLRKGSQVFVEGRLQSRKYQDREGVERTTVEVVAGDLVLLGGRQADGGAGAGGMDVENPPF